MELRLGCSWMSVVAHPRGSRFGALRLWQKISHTIKRCRSAHRPLATGSLTFRNAYNGEQASSAHPSGITVVEQLRGRATPGPDLRLVTRVDFHRQLTISCVHGSAITTKSPNRNQSDTYLRYSLQILPSALCGQTAPDTARFLGQAQQLPEPRCLIDPFGNVLTHFASRLGVPRHDDVDYRIAAAERPVHLV